MTSKIQGYTQCTTLQYGITDIGRTAKDSINVTQHNLPPVTGQRMY